MALDTAEELLSIISMRLPGRGRGTAPIPDEIAIIPTAGFWIDTGANDSLVENDDLFTEAAGVISTESALTAINSTWQDASDESTWLEYTFEGEMQTDTISGEIGVSFLSQFPDSAVCYRLKAVDGGTFRITATGTSFPTGDLETGVEVQEGVWFLFKINLAKVQVEDQGGGIFFETVISAKVWPQGSTEPPDWQAVCQGSLQSGRVGVYAGS